MKTANNTDEFDDKPEKPKKKRVVKKKLPPKRKRIPKKITDIPSIQDLEDTQTLKKLINNQLELGEYKKKRLESERDIHNLCAQIAEYLDCFMLVGYDLNKNRVMIKKAVSNQDEDSLVEAVRYMFYRTMQGDQDN